MSIQPWVIVEPPDNRGLRKVVISGKTVGSAWSSRELRKILSRLGYPKNMDIEDPTSIHWRGGDSKVWPDHPWRRRTILLLMVTGMLASAAWHLLIGWPDALKALTFAQRIVGIIFVLLSLLQGLAAFTALDYYGKRQWKASGAITIIGALIAFPTNAILLFMWFEETEYTPYLFAFLPLLVWSIWAIFLLVREKSWHGTPHPTKFATGVAFTSVLTAVSIAYSTMYEPTAAPIHFVLKTEFGTPQTSANGKYVTIPLKLYAKNDGGIPVYFINDDFTVWGRSASYSAKGEGMERWKSDTEEIGDASEAERFIREIKEEIISSGHFQGPGTELDVGEEFVSEEVVRLPRNAKYDELEAHLEIDIMRRDRGRVDEQFGYPWYSWDKEEGNYYCPPKDCGEYVIYHGRVRHNNNMINLTRKSRYLTAFWGPEFTPDNFISSFDFKKKVLEAYQDIDAAEVEREAERYGVSTYTTNCKIPTERILHTFVG
ncbi:hypothetical protein ABZ027_05275 [Streptomyces sp. NPDC006332]|uniref:hypothetical protein n=1 Tax=Streptomyces sp. NPDC006332 TaxID=3155456 RepID=UPI0033A1AB56